MFAHAAAETMGAIFDTYQQQTKPRSPQGSRGGGMHTGPAPFPSQETGFLEVWEPPPYLPCALSPPMLRLTSITRLPQVFPRVSSRPPKLLEQLESILVDRLRNNDRAASTAALLTKDRDPGMSTNLSLDAHRQVGLRGRG